MHVLLWADLPEGDDTADPETVNKYIMAELPRDDNCAATGFPIANAPLLGRYVESFNKRARNPNERYPYLFILVGILSFFSAHFLSNQLHIASLERWCCDDEHEETWELLNTILTQC